MLNVSNLVAADAMYHRGCYTKFTLQRNPGKLVSERGRAPSTKIKAAMNKIYELLENGEERKREREREAKNVSII